MAAFGDFGMAWDEGSEFKTDNFIGGFGVGLRLLIPVVGMMRFDFAWGQSGRAAFFHIGSFEKAVMSRKRVR